MSPPPEFQPSTVEFVIGWTAIVLAAALGLTVAIVDLVNARLDMRRARLAREVARPVLPKMRVVR